MGAFMSSFYELPPKGAKAKENILKSPFYAEKSAI
jgi:hypothetical protein